MGNLIGWHSLSTTTVSEKKQPKAVVTSSGTLSTAVFPAANDRNVALYDISGGYRALGIVVDGSATVSTESTVIHSIRFDVRTSGVGYCLVLSDTSGSATASKAIVMTATHLAVNANNDLIVRNSGITVGGADEDGYINFGDKALRVVRKGNDWFLVAYVA